MRTAIESGGGSLTIAPLPPRSVAAELVNGGATALSAENAIDFWGGAGDALPLMAAVKRQFDPQRTLNPGRFVGGI
jgi:FAD/FMN-containing dehydrogenase